MPNDRIRLNLDMPPATMELLEELKEAIQAPSRTEVVKRALLLYQKIVSHNALGYRVVLEVPDEENIELLIL